jgi:serine/threonine-protein kinase
MPGPVGGCHLHALLERSARAWRPLSEAFCCYVLAEAASILHLARRLTDSRGLAPGLAPLRVTPFHVQLTAHGLVKLEGLATPEEGSLAYAAPELACQQPADARSEVFSLGLVLLQLLTGRHLFPGAERFEAEWRRARARQAHDAALEVCARELARCLLAYGPPEREAATRAVSVELRPIVHRALAPSPAERYPDSEALARALREHLRRTGQSFGPAEVRAELAALGG